jgi:hypothetical protein
MYTSSISKALSLFLVMAFVLLGSLDASAQKKSSKQNKSPKNGEVSGDTKPQQAAPAQPTMLDGQAAEPQPVKTEIRDAATGRILYHEKILLQKESAFNALRPRFNAVKGDELINEMIRSMYQPDRGMQQMDCNLSVSKDFDKSQVPDDLSNAGRLISALLTPEVRGELNFCLSYLGYNYTDAQLYVFYILPYKNHILYFQQSGLKNRDLAWMMAIDFRQSVCAKNTSLVIKEVLLKPTQPRIN